MEAAKAAGRSVDLYVGGKKGVSFFRYSKVAMKETFTTLSDKPSFDDAESFDDFGYHWTPNGQIYVADRLLALLARSGIVEARPAQEPDREGR